VRVVALGLVLFGLHALYTRAIPVGWEGRPPSFHLRGLVAVLVGIVVLGIGIAMLVFAPAAACALSSAVSQLCRNISQ
jgi:uncharacterized membrane protein YczE